MRENKMQEWMQQDLAVPQKVHDGFEKGIQQIYHIETLQKGVEIMGAGKRETEQKAGQRKGRLFWRRAGLAAAAVAAVCVIAFHSQIYSFAKSLFVHDTITVGEEKAQETDMRIVKINDGVLTNDLEPQFFESMEDLGDKLGVSFLKSSMENTETGKGRIRAVMYEWGEVRAYDAMFCVKDLSGIQYSEDGAVHSHMDSEDAYSIECAATFYTKAFQDDYGLNYENAEVIEDYKTKNGFTATIIRFEGAGGCLTATLSHNNIRYEFSISDEGCTLEEFKAFLDTLTE